MNRLYQLIISRLDGDKIPFPAYQDQIFRLVQKGIGGFIIFGGERAQINPVRSLHGKDKEKETTGDSNTDTETSNGVKPFIDKIQSMSEIPLFIASDIERGVGQQIKGYTEFPCQMAVCAAICKDNSEALSLLKDAVSAIANESMDAGINMPLMPVLDVNQNPLNPIICTRAFSDEPQDVSWFGKEYIKILEGLGLISCAKHFPGHGDTSIDSHISLPVIAKSYNDLLTCDVAPFVKAIESGVSSIMVGHLLVPDIDKGPASLSEKVIKGLLREKLGFDGLVITDALNMKALNGIDNVPARCIKAGVDILLHPLDADAAVSELAEAFKTKNIDETHIDAAISRILKAKSRLKHVKKQAIDYNRHKTLSTNITDASITLMQKAEMLPITSARVIIVGADKLCKLSLWEGHFGNISKIGDILVPEGFNRGTESPLDKIIFAIFTENSAWKGSSGIGDKEKHQIIEHIGKARGSIVISFGSPYILPYFKDADILIAAYGVGEDAQKAVIKCLKGEMEFKGKMPVKL